jgi:ABC-2 type transport system ATP-binding protein
MPAVEALNLRKVYRVYRKENGIAGAIKGLFKRKYDETPAVDGVSFSVEPGEFVGFLGPNGAGKTTTLKMLSGLVQPSSGEASVLGFVPWHRKNAMKRQFSLLMGQKNALWWDLPARESLELNRAIYGIERDDFQRTVDELTALLDCRDKLGVMVRELSLGERMKFELIAALLHHPKVLFLDEPTIGLDVISQKKVREFLKAYNADNRITILLTSHYMQDIEELCERVILIDHGKLFFDGPLDAVLDRFATTKLLEVEFATVCGADFARLGRIVESEGTRIKLEVPRAQVADVCRELLACGPVTDFSVQEIPIEEIIRQVFGAQQKLSAAEAQAETTSPR